MDVFKLQEKNRLAKALVEKGIASDMHDAFNQIEKKGMVKEFGDTVAEEMEMEDAVAAVQRQQQSMMERGDLDKHADVLNRLESIEGTLSAFKEFFGKYKELNDNNLKEVDSRLKEIAKRVIEMKSGASTQQTPQSPQQQQTLPKPAPKDDEIKHPQAGLDPNEFSVEKYFNNSNNKLAKK